MRFKWSALVLFVLVVVPMEGAYAQKRTALVVGNSAYEHTPKLVNPKNDAADMAAALKKHGFHVIEGLDLDKSGFDRKVRDFAAALRGSEAGIFFYAGHGLQVGGQNYLVPIDAKAEELGELDFEMVRVESVQRAMEGHPTTNILFLDACRDNPLARNLARSMGTRSSEVGRGLAAVQSGVGTLISFSTQPGNVALDGTGRNSPFAGALVKQVSSANDDLSAILIAVRNDVMKATQRKQVPWEHSALTGRFFFSPLPMATPLPQAAPSQASEAAEAWDRTKDSTNGTVLEAYVDRYKDTYYAHLARARIEELKKVVATSPPDTKPTTAPQVKTADKAPIPKRTSGESLRDCADCPDMVILPAGGFTMGSPTSEKGRSTSEGPQRKVTIEKPFAVGKFEVTFAEWEACVAGGGCASNKSPSDQGWGKGQRPVINVSWVDAKEYATWLSRRTGKTYRLLSEAEWEYAARAGTSTTYSWGNDIGKNQANCSGCGSQWDKKQTSPVGSFSANAFELRDMHGNVWEWVEDCWHSSYQGAPTDGSPWTTSCDDPSPLLRGGSWFYSSRSLRAANRYGNSADDRVSGFGFRVAKTLDP